MRIASILLLAALSAQAQDYSEHKELFMANQAGGDVVLTLEPCAIEDAKLKGFTNRTYATIAGGKIMEEGCWVAPSIEDAPVNSNIKIIPIVNVWYDYTIIPFEQSLFGPKSRTKDVKGDI